jgi:hypothetical protein
VSQWNGLTGYPCSFVTGETLPAQNYHLIITDSNNFATLSPYYNLTIKYTYQNTQCRNITNELSTCAGRLPADRNYEVSAFELVFYENNADAIYNDLSDGWSCDNVSRLWDYACQSAFQPYQCDDNGQKTAALLCEEQCTSTLAEQCKGGAKTNLCETLSCKSASDRVQACNTPPPPPPNGSIGLSPFIFGSFFIFLFFYFM